MSSVRPGTAGATRVCPHCKTTILDSAAVCPSCKHHVRFEAAGQHPLEKSSALRVEGVIRHPPDGAPWEYSVVLTIRNDRGEEVARRRGLLPECGGHPHRSRGEALEDRGEALVDSR